MNDSKSSDEPAPGLLPSAVGSSSPLTILDEFSTVGIITDDAAHWQIEPFVPIDELEVRQMLDARQSNGDAPFAAQDWDRLLRKIDDHLDSWSGMRSRQVMSAYRLCDPDRRQSVAEESDSASEQPDAPDDLEASISPSLAKMEPADKVSGDIEQLALAAGYTVVPQDQIEQCVGIASHWGVPLHIDFSAFERLDVYARGDVVGYRIRRHFKSMYLRKIVEVPVYRRMLVAFEMKGDAKYIEPTTDNEATPKGSDQLQAPARCVHLRMFKNIPKQDVDMLLPTAKVKISGVDRLKIVLPSLGGFLMSLRKIAQFTLLLAALALHWVAILAAIAIGYLVKSFLSYFQTRNRYQLNLTKNLYFQKLGAGDIVLTALVQQAVSQRRVEAMIAYYALALADEPLSTRRLKRRCQRYIREGIDVEIEFRVDRALTLLVDAGIVNRNADGWQILSNRKVAQ